MLDTLNTRTTEAESRISTAEDQLVSLDSRVQKEKKITIAQRSQKNNGPVMYEDKPVMFFPDLSASLMIRRKEFDQVKRELQTKENPFALLHPATLRVTLPDGGRKLFKTPKEAAAFLRDSPERT